MSKIDMSLIKVANRDLYKDTATCNAKNDICYKYKIQVAMPKSDIILYDAQSNIMCIEHKLTSSIEQVKRGKHIHIYYYYGDTSFLSMSNLNNCHNACQQGIYELHANVLIHKIMLTIDRIYKFKYVKHSVLKDYQYYMEYIYKVI